MVENAEAKRVEELKKELERLKEAMLMWSFTKSMCPKEIDSQILG